MRPPASGRFVTQKIVGDAGRIADVSGEKLHLGNTSIARYWGWASEYAEAMGLMLQQDNPDDFVITTGETNTLEIFVAEAFPGVGVDSGEHVICDASLLRPSESMVSRGNPSKVAASLGCLANLRMGDVVIKMIAAHREISQGDRVGNSSYWSEVSVPASGKNGPPSPNMLY